LTKAKASVMGQDFICSRFSTCVTGEQVPLINDL